MSVVCEVCGDVGYKYLLLHCSSCKYATRHRYCLDVVIYDTSLVEWLCNDCLPKHNEVTKSLENVSNQRQLSNIQLSNEPNVKKVEVTKGLWSWGLRRNRSRKARRDCSDGSDLQKRGMVASILQPSSLHKNSLNKSIPGSENMDLVLKKSCCPLNDPRSNYARQLLTEVDQMEPSRQFDHTYSHAFLEVSSKTEVYEANVTELEHYEAAQSFKNGKPKKRRRLILPYDEDEDAEAMRVEDLNPRSCNDDGQVKKHRRYVENGVKNQRRYVENCEEALQPGNLNCLSFKNHTPVKMQRSIEANEDENAVVGDLNAGCAQNDNSQCASQTAVMEDHCGLFRMPLISGYICVQPIDKPYWTGIMKIGRDFISLAAHLSTKACKKVWEVSRFLGQIMKVTELSTLKAWPKSWVASKPTADSIGLYFFSDNMRPNKDLDQLVKYVTDCGIVLETVVGFAKLLIFSSVVLPEEYQMFQGKHYLWGVFKRRQDRSRRSAPVQQDCTAHVAEEEQVQEQQDKAQCDTLDQEMPVVKHVVHSKNQPLLDANQDVGMEALPGNGPPSAEMNSLQVQLNCFQRSPNERKENAQEFTCLPGSDTSPLVEPIQEMENEGALLFAVQERLAIPGSIVGANNGAASELVHEDHAVASEACLEQFPVTQLRSGPVTLVS